MKLLQQAEPPEERDNVDAQKPAVQTQGPETPICNSSGAHKRHFYALQYFPMFEPRKQQTRHTVDGVGARVAEGHNVPFGGVLPHASLEEKLNFILADTMSVEDTTAPDLNPADVMKTLQAMLAQNPDDDAGPPQTSFRSVRSESPINEFKNTDILYYMALPCLFPFGRGLPEGSSALPDKTVRHLLLQYHGRHARDQRFCFSQFNMRQRHAASRAAVLRVRNSRGAINEFIAMTSEDTFKLRLSLAVDDPDSDDAKFLARKILPLMTSVGATVPYSPSERKDMFSRFVSSMYQYGAGFLFVSAAFDDKAHVFAVRLAIPSTNNSSFPAKDGGLLEQMFNCEETFKEIGTPFTMKIDDTSLLRLISDSPVASVQFFRTLFEVVAICIAHAIIGSDKLMSRSRHFLRSCSAFRRLRNCVLTFHSHGTLLEYIST
jgi:hypothetical protein